MGPVGDVNCDCLQTAFNSGQFFIRIQCPKAFNCPGHPVQFGLQGIGVEGSELLHADQQILQGGRLAAAGLHQ